MWGTTILAIWEHIVGTTIKDSFLWEFWWYK
jgi:hypothetical protein